MKTKGMRAAVSAHGGALAEQDAIADLPGPSRRDPTAAISTR